MDKFKYVVKSDTPVTIQVPFCFITLIRDMANCCASENSRFSRKSAARKMSYVFDELVSHTYTSLPNDVFIFKFD